MEGDLGSSSEDDCLSAFRLKDWNGKSDPRMIWREREVACLIILFKKSDSFMRELFGFFVSLW